MFGAASGLLSAVPRNGERDASAARSLCSAHRGERVFCALLARMAVPVYAVFVPCISCKIGQDGARRCKGLFL